MTLQVEPLPFIHTPQIGSAEPRNLCTDCGISRTEDAKRCGHACQFIKPDYSALETQVHGRSRDASRPDEMFFGPFQRMFRTAMHKPETSGRFRLKLFIS